MNSGARMQEEPPYTMHNGMFHLQTEWYHPKPWCTSAKDLIVWTVPVPSKHHVSGRVIFWSNAYINLCSHWGFCCHVQTPIHELLTFENENENDTLPHKATQANHHILLNSAIMTTNSYAFMPEDSNDSAIWDSVNAEMMDDYQVW